MGGILISLLLGVCFDREICRNAGDGSTCAGRDLMESCLSESDVVAGDEVHGFEDRIEVAPEFETSILILFRPNTMLCY